MKTALREALDERGYTSLTPVQQAVLDPDLEGRDLLVSAQTGSGKTLAFGLAIAPTLLPDTEVFNPAGAPLALVIAPTRELAIQVKRELVWLFQKAGATIASCVGGMDMRDERRALARGAHIVAATPGRLRDHIMRGSIDLASVRAVVLDEADEMLDLGFREDLEFILGAVPDDRQTLLFSATVPKSIAELAKTFQKDARRIVAKSEATQHADIEYCAMMVADHDVDNAVINTLRLHEAPNALVFANTRAMVNRLGARLSNRGFQAVVLSGELSQSERTHALQAMRDGRARVCVATDVAARGIDLPKLDLVIHAELPSNHETLLHRSGRTGRAGRKGVSALIVTRKTRKKAERILGLAKVKADWTSAPSASDVRERDDARLFADPEWQDAIAETEQDTVDRLVATFSAEQIAAAFLRLVRTMHAPPEELSDADSKPAPRKEFGPSVWFAVSIGRDDAAEPRRLLPMLCRAGNLTKDDIGAIRIQKDRSFVQILETSVAGFLSAVGQDRALEDGVTLTQLASPPDLERSAPTPPSKPTRGRLSVTPARATSDAPASAPAEQVARPAQPDGGKKPAVHKPRHKSVKADAPGGAKPARGEFGEKTPDRGAKPYRKPKGTPPPAGKPSSKKNRARALASAKPKGKAGPGDAGKRRK